MVAVRARLESFAALRERQFALLFWSQAVSVLGTGMVPVALAFAVLDLAGSASDLGLVLAARLVPAVVFLLTGGIWADRLSGRSLMIVANLIQMASQALLGFLLVTGEARIWEFVALQIVQGTATGFGRPALRGLLAEVAPPQGRQQANALMYGAAGLAAAVGPALAGVFVATVGPGWAILGDAASFALAVMLLIPMRPPALSPPPRTGFLRELGQGWREVISRRWLWAGTTNAAIAQLAWLSTFSVLGPLVAKRSLGGSSAWALIVVAFGVGAILGNVIALHIRPRRPLFVAYAVTIGCSASLFLLAVAAPAPLIAATELYSGAAVVIVTVLWQTTLQEQIPPVAFGRVAAYDMTGAMVLRPLGLLIAAPLASLIGVSTTLIGAGVITAANSALLLLLVPEVREMRSGKSDPRGSTSSSGVSTPSAPSGRA
jgi:predicted MFS family arabinose efflux permease